MASDLAGPPGSRPMARRSWFSPANSSRDEPIKNRKPCRDVQEEGEVETLLLTHFTAPPRIDFGTVRLGKSRTRKLVIRNPHDYEQQVFLEKFPFTMGFTTEMTEFFVDANQDVLLTITWTPTEAGNCRQMTLFLVEDTYRLQAILFGKSEAPPKPRKRKGLRGSCRPFSVLQANTTAPSNARRATYNKTSPKVLMASRVTTATPPVIRSHPQPVLDKENTPPQMHIRDMGISGYSPAFLQKRASMNLEQSSPGFFPSPQVALVEQPEEKGSSPQSPQFEDSLVVPPAPDDDNSASETSKRSGTFEMNQTDSILYQKSLNYTTSTQATFNVHPEAGHEMSALGASTSKRNTFDMDHNDSILYHQSYDYGKSPQPSFKVHTTAAKNASKSDAEGSKHGGTFELDQTDSILYHRTYDYNKSRAGELGSAFHGRSGMAEDENASRHGTFELDEPSICLSRHASFAMGDDASSGKTSKHGTFDMEKSSVENGTYELDTTAEVRCELHHDCHTQPRKPGFGETLTKYHSDQGPLLEEMENIKCTVADNQDILADSLLEPPTSVPLETAGRPDEIAGSVATHAAFVGAIGHVSMMRHLTAVQQDLQDQIIASTPVVQNSRASFDSLTARKLPSPVHGKPGRLSDSAVQSGFFPSPHCSPFVPRDNHRISSGESPRRNSRKLLFPDNASPPRRISNVTITKVGKPESGNRGPGGVPGNVTVVKSGSGDSLPHATFQEIPSPDGRRISTLTVTKPRSSVGRVTVTADCGLDSLCQQLSLSIKENDIQSPPAKMSRSISMGGASGGQMIAGNARRSLYPNESPKRTVCTPVLRQSARSTHKLSEKRKAARRSGKLRRHHRRSVTHTLDESERSFCDLPDVHIDSPEDKGVVETPSPEHDTDRLSVDSQSQRKSPALERLAKSPAKYAGIFMDIKEKPNVRTTYVQPTVTLKTSVSKAKLKISPKGKPKGRLSGERLSRGSPRRSSNGGGGRTSMSSLMRPTAASKARRSQATHNIQVAVTIQEVKAEARPKGFTRTMELRRKAALAKSGGGDKRSSGGPKRPSCSVPATRKPAPAAKPVSTSTKPVSMDTKPIPASRKPVAAVSKPAVEMRAATTKPKLPKNGLAKNKLTLIKPKMHTVLPKHPMPFAAKNIYYDERWMEKQERGFVRWLNFILTPPDEHVDAVKPKKVDAGALCVESRTAVRLAPSKETLSLRAYTARRRLNHLRRAACRLFQSEAMVHVHRKLEVEIECGRLALRKDRKLHADIGLKQRVLDLLLSYNPLWLRIGLEAVFGEMIPVLDNTDVIGLSRFILTRLLDNPEIAQQYAHPTVPHLYRPGYDETLAQFTLKKFLLLILVLDLAKVSRLIQHDPCLFCRDSEFKASRDLLIAFSRDFLSGEGDVTKHLGYLGYHVRHHQKALDEYDYAVENLAIDLRDGVRLVRIVALLTTSWTSAYQVRVPAISRLQKVHNTELAFRALREHGLDLTAEQGNLSARDVVDGNREKTLAMLWRLIFNFQVEMLLSEQQLEDEIRILRENLRFKTQLAALVDQNTAALGLPRDRRQSMEPDVYFKSPRLSLLLKWCQAVCAHYNIKVENFTVSFSDGRALCYLVHHYHPALLPRDAIQQDTTQTYHDDTADDSTDLDDSFACNWTSTYSPSTGLPTHHEELLNNERQNFKLLYDKVSELGGIPMLLRATDMSNTIPDEKVVLTYVSYLCMRLMDIRTEARAARVIQMAWRWHYLRKHRQLKRVEHAAATTIQTAVRSFLERRRLEQLRDLIVLMQARCRGYLARRHTKIMRLEREQRVQVEAAVLIQSLVRGYLVRRRVRMERAVWQLEHAWSGVLLRRQFLHKRVAAQKIQRWVRAAWVLREEETRQYAACLVQAWWRGIQAGRQQRRTFIHLKWAAITIQKSVRRALYCKRYQRVRGAVVSIQAAARGWSVRRKFLVQKNAALTLQRHVRAEIAGRQQRCRYLKEKQAAVVIQKHFYRWHVKRLQFEETQRQYAALSIQRWYRACRLRCEAVLEYQTTRRAVILIQHWYRATQLRSQARHQYQSTRKAVLTIEQYYLAWKLRCQDQDDYQQLRQAALLVQHCYRARCLRRQAECQYHALRQAAMCLQQRYRARLQQRQTRDQYLQLREAVVCVQRRYRAVVCQRLATKQYHSLRSAALCIQRRFRARVVAKHSAMKYQQTRTAVICLQRWFRALQLQQRATQDYRHFRLATMCIQRWYRAVMLGRRVQHEYLSLRESVLVVQQRFRASEAGKRERRAFLIQKGATITIQAWWKGLRQREAYVRQLAAAVTLQRHYRGYSERQHYVELRRAAVTIQHWYRQLRVGAACRQEFLVKLGCVLTLQSWWKAHLQRQEYAAMRSAAVCIQTHVRRYQAQESYHRHRAAAITIQQWFRDVLYLRSAARQQVAAVCIQAAWRGHRQLCSYQQLLKACLCIQAAVRGHQARVNLSCQQQAAVILQQHARAWLVGRHEYLRYTCLRNAVITCQAVARGWSVRKGLAELHGAAQTVQQRWRARRTGRAQRVCYLEMKEASVCLQHQWRALLECRKQRRAYLIQRDAVISVQQHWRAKVWGHAQRKAYLEQKAAVLTLERQWMAWNTGQHQRSGYLRLRWAAVTLQRLWRARATCLHLRDAYTLQRQAVVTLQQRWRARRQGLVQRLVYDRTKKAALVVQQRWRARQECQLQRKAYVIQRTAAVTLQQLWRARCLGCEQRQAYLKQKSAAITIQQHWLAARASQWQRQQFLVWKDAALTVQQHWRAWKLGRVEKAAYMRLRWAVITMQRQWRARQACRRQRQEFTSLLDAAVLLQKHWRARRLGHMERQAFLVQKGAVLTLQWHWRAHVVGMQQRNTYVQFREAAITMQLYWRARQVGHTHRQAYLEQRTAAVCIQQLWRSKQLTERQRKIFLIQKGAAITVQQYWRARQVGHTHRQAYLEQRTAAVCIQQLWRSKQLTRTRRKIFLIQKGAAITVQQYWRARQVGHTHRQAYLEQRTAAVCIQQLWRSKQLTRTRRKIFLIQKGAAITVQQYWRARQVGHTHRQAYLKQRTAAVCIQQLWRSKQLTERQRKIFLIQKGAAITLQQYWRARQVGHTHRQAYLEQRTAAVCIQQLWRSKQLTERQRKIFLIQKGAAITVQQYWRARQVGHTHRQAYLKQRTAAVCIQQLWRSKQLTERQRKIFLIQKGAAITVQQYWRARQVGHTHRQAYLEQKTAAVCIQLLWRSKQLTERQRKMFLIQKGAAITVQQYWRARQIGHTHRQAYLEQRTAAVCIQQLWRSKQLTERQRKMFLIQKGAAITVQQYWRARQIGHTHRQAYLEQRTAAVCIQQLWRSKQLTRTQRKIFLIQKGAAITVQQHWRAWRIGVTEQNTYFTFRSTVIQIQQRWRALQSGRQLRTLYLNQRRAAVTLQQHWRANQACQHRRREYLHLHCAAVTLQRRWRARQCALAERAAYLHQKMAAVTLQSGWRALQAGRRDRRWFLLQKGAAVILQQQWRACLVMRTQRAHYLRLREATCIIQSRWRAVLLSRVTWWQFQITVGATITLQMAVRAYLARKHYLHLRTCVCRMQRMVRAKQTRAQFLHTRNVIVNFQRKVRSWQAMKKQRARYTVIRGATVTLQSVVRGWSARRRVKSERAAITIQAAYRAFRQHRTYLQQREAALCIQRHFRRHQQYVEKVGACVRLQASLRMYLLRRRYLELRQAAVTVQTRWRAHCQRAHYLHTREAVITLQCWVRAYQQHAQFLKCRQATRILQRWWRALQCMRRERSCFLEQRAAALRIQQGVRCWMNERRVRYQQKCHAAATCIQAVVRGHQQRRRYCRQRGAAICLQATVRTWLARGLLRQLQHRHQAAVRIQQAFREFSCQRKRQAERAAVVTRFSEQARLHLSAMVCQRAVRRYLLLRRAEQQLCSILVIQHWMRGRLQRLRFLRLRESVQLLQAVMRWYMVVRHQAATTLQSAVRRWLLHRRAEHKHQAATKIQALWRGWRLRQKVKDRRMKEVRRRVQKATEAATEETTLGSRTSSALDFLLKYKQLSYILEAVRNLEVSTRLSPICCKRLVAANAVGVIFRLIRSCNRSLPHMEIIKHSIAILINLAKYGCTVSDVYAEEDCIECLVELLQIYRGKGAIFSHTCTLIAILVHDPQRKQDVLSMPKLLEKLRSLHSITERHAKLDQRRSVAKTRLASGSRGGPAIPGHVHIRPDWELRRDSLKEIDDPLQAITFVMNSLGLKSKS